MSVSSALTYTDLKKGVRARIAAVTRQEADTLRLMEMGFTVGAVFRVVKVAPLGDPVEIEVRGYRVCLRRREVEAFQLESVNEHDS
jgi:Fe2+ transport system protein FeoA